MAILNNESGTYAANIVQDALGAPTMPPDFKAIYDKFSHRVVWIDGEVVPGAFQMNTAWYAAVPERDPIFTEHVHDDADELIGFFSCDPSNPNDLGAKSSFPLEGKLTCSRVRLSSSCRQGSCTIPCAFCASIAPSSIFPS